MLVPISKYFIKLPPIITIGNFFQDSQMNQAACGVGQAHNALPSTNVVDRDPAMQTLGEALGTSQRTTSFLTDFAYWCDRVRNQSVKFSPAESEAMFEAFKSVMQITVVPAEAPRKRAR